MVALVLWLVFGGLVGWVASLLTHREGQGTLVNIGVGLLGAGIGGFLFNRNVAPDVFSFGSVLTALVGAVILLVVLNLAQRARA